MTNDLRQENEMQEALALYDQGIPVAIQDPRLRMYLEGHRFGYHPRQEAKGYCPACDREAVFKNV